MKTATTLPQQSALSQFTCSECQAGQMKSRLVTYFTWLGDELITVPDFLAWVCDVCHRCEYDLRALNELSLLLSPIAGKGIPRRRSIHPQPIRKNSRLSQPE